MALQTPVKTTPSLRTAVTFGLMCVVALILSVSWMYRGKLLAAAATSGSPTVMGYCTWGALLNVGEGRMSADACKAKSTWLTFCPDPTGKQGSCTCVDENHQKSPMLQELIDSRNDMIELATSGNVLTTEETGKLLKFSWAPRINCECGVITGPLKPASGEEDLVTWTAPAAIGTITGKFELVSKTAKMFNYMKVPNLASLRNSVEVLPPGTEPHCQIIPPGCRVTDRGSYRSNEGQSSPHGAGQAVDISCQEPITGQSCSGKAAVVLAKGLQYNPGMNIIQECTTYERRKDKCGDGTNVQVVHFDIKYSSSPGRVNPPGTNCLFRGCDFTCDEPIPTYPPRDPSDPPGA